MKFLKNILSFKKNNGRSPQVLLEDESPYCPITAGVEQDERVVCFYLFGAQQTNFQMKSCWVRNLTEAPDRIDEKSMKKGIPPMLTKEFCKYPSGQDKLEKKDLEIIWLEEGDGAALLYKKEILAIIPSWSGFGGFYGYARDCKGSGDFAWELNEKNDLVERVKRSQDFFDSWDSTINPFQLEQPNILNYYAEVFGESEKYFAIDSDKGMPRGLYVQEGETKTVFATVALSLVPMPTIEMSFENREEVNRIELGLMLNSGLSENQIQSISEWISGTASIPWENITFLSEGHTVLFDSFNHPQFKSVLLTNKLTILPKVNLENYAKTKTNFLWMIPISGKERDRVMKDGSSKIVEYLEKIGEEIFSLDRNEVI